MLDELDDWTMGQNNNWGTWNVCQQIHNTDYMTYYIQTIAVSSPDMNMMSNTSLTTFMAHDATTLCSPMEVMLNLLNLPIVNWNEELEHSAESENKHRIGNTAKYIR
jgi:hypothetical protein